jgi:hypothetical protein
MYDLIGDIHGYATELKALLTKMDYEEIDGVWQHPERKVIFLGDFVDRGPEQVETVEIARKMVESGNALAVMGNHEYNAVAWATEDPQNSRQFLRPHTSKNYDQHREFLAQVGEGSELHHRSIEWFKTLPLFLDLPEFRVVHACWHPEYLGTIKPFLDDQNRLLPSAWEQTSREGAEAYDALETLLKGVEIRLPSGYEFRDKYDHARSNIRTRWWDMEGVTYRDLAMVPADVIELIPHDPIPEDVLPKYDNEKPVFVGHYWMSGEPAPLNDYVACLDYSVAGKHGGKLCAYQHKGDRYLSAKNFVWAKRPTHRE